MSVSKGLWAIVPAAGSGLRMRADRPKQYLPLLGRSVLHCTLERLGSFPTLQGVLVGIAQDDPYWPTVSAEDIPGLLGSFTGGAERAITVLKGLRELSRHAPDSDWVLVHDAVRPCVRHSDIQALVAMRDSCPDGALLGLPLADTVKRTDESGGILETVSRDGLWRALTPQLFPIGLLRGALERALQAKVAITDEASAMEHVGRHPRMVAGHADNIKITVAGDLALAELYLRQQKTEGV